MTATPPEGWFPDPMGRAEERRWDGAQWTSRVRDAGLERDDPVGAGAGPVADDVAATAGSDAPDLLRSGPPMPGLVAHLRRDRPSVDPVAAVAAAAGILGVVGAYAFVAESNGTAGPSIVSILVLGATYALALVGPSIARPAAIVGGLVAPMVLILVLLEEPLDGRSNVVVPAMLLAAVWLGMFLLPGLRAAPALIAAALLGMWIAIVALTATDDPYSSYYGDSSPVYVGVPSPVVVDPFGGLTALIQAAGAVTLVVALVVAVLAAVLDRRRWHVAATPLLGVAVFLAITGLYMSFFGSQSLEGNAVLVAIVGVVLVVVGALGGRRGSSWIGVALATSGILTLVISIADEAVPAGIGLLAVAAVVLLTARGLKDRLDGPAPAE